MEDLKVFEEVLDRPTLLTLYRLLNKGFLTELHGVVNSGKEALVFAGRRGEQEVAVKIYRVTALRFRNIYPYIVGDQRFMGLRRSRRALIYAWTLKEYKNLKRMYKAGVRVPRPIAVLNNVLVMEFIGRDGAPAPLLKDQPPEKPEETFKLLANYVELMYRRARLVHADLSEYNVMMWNGEPVIIDVAQAVLTSHPMAMQFLRRDVENLVRFFGRLGVKTPKPEELIRQITKPTNGEQT